MLTTTGGEHRFHFACAQLCGHTMSKESRRCARPGCRAWAMRGQLLCRAHNPSGRASKRTGQTSAGTRHPLTAAGTRHPFYDGVFSREELEDIARQLESAQHSLEMEVAVMRVMIRRVMERIGQEDPLKALPLIRQGVDAICRALRTERVLTGEADL